MPDGWEAQAEPGASRQQAPGPDLLAGRLLSPGTMPSTRSPDRFSWPRSDEDQRFRAHPCVACPRRTRNRSIRDRDTAVAASNDHLMGFVLLRPGAERRWPRAGGRTPVGYFPASASWTAARAGFGSRFSSQRQAAPSLGKLYGTHEYLSPNPQTVMPTHDFTARQAWTAPL
jgi:hypothetical protein